MTDKIACAICGASIHAVQSHIKEAHADWTVERYKGEYPTKPLLSEMAKTILAKRKESASIAPAPVAAVGGKIPMHEAFGFGAVPAALNKRGEPIMINRPDTDPQFADLVPDIDPSYIFDIELTKTVIMGVELNMSVYLWGMHGTGKTTQFEQVCARTGRVFMRVQHTIGTEESHIVGQMLVRDGATHFEYGPLALAMKHGWVYCADEYDFAMPSVLAVYQPVLERKALVIKEAPAEQRIVRPHPNFRFVATGNTNGGGDETGLYQGTQLQNAANYSRFGIVSEVLYMEEKQEIAVLCSQAKIPTADAKKVISFCNDVRKAHRAGQISSTISTREAINSAILGVARGSEWRVGLALGYTNRLNRIDKEVVDQYAQRIFG